MEDVAWSLPIRLDVLASSHPHLKPIARTRVSGLDKQYHMYGAGPGGYIYWEAGAWVELALFKVQLDPRPAIRWPGAGSAVSVDQRVALRVVCRNGYRSATLLLSMLSLLSQQVPRKKGFHDSFDPNNSCLGIYNERHWFSRAIAG